MYPTVSYFQTDMCKAEYVFGRHSECSNSTAIYSQYKIYKSMNTSCFGMRKENKKKKKCLNKKSVVLQVC